MGENESIRIQIKKIDKVISSLKQDLSKNPKDKISSLNLKTFERMKQDFLLQI